MEVNQYVLDIYEKPVLDGKSRLQLWEKGLAFGSSITPSTFCPEYRKQFLKIVTDLLPPEKFKRVLTLGCGNAKIEKDLHDNKYNVLATDISKEGIKLAKDKGLNARFLDAREDFPIEIGSFDVILSDGVIGHLFDNQPSIDSFLQNCLTKLSDGGALFIANDPPTKPNEEIQKHDDLDLYWVSQDYLEKKLKQNGYEAIQSKLLSYFRPGYDTRLRILTWGFKSRLKESTPQYDKLKPYKNLVGAFEIPFANESPFTYFIMEPGVSVEPHIHEYTSHVIYVINGTVIFNIDGKITRLTAKNHHFEKFNQEVLSKLPQIKIPPKHKHAVMNHSSTKSELLCYDNPKHP